MEMRPGHAPRVSNQSNDLSAVHDLADVHQRFAQVEVRRYDSTAVIDVHHVAGEKEIVDERDDPTIGGFHRLADCAAKVHTEVAGGQCTVEETAGTELACNYRSARLDKRRRPHRPALVCCPADFPRARVLTIDARLRCRIQWPGERAVNFQRLRRGWRDLGKVEAYPRYLSLTGRALQYSVGEQYAFPVDRNAADGVPGVGARPTEVKWFVSQRAANRNDRVSTGRVA
jgi:hypothetical protein